MRYGLDVANPLRGLNQAVATGLERNQQEQAQAAQQATLNQAMQLMHSGDMVAFNKLLGTNPGLRDHLIATQGHMNADTMAQKVNVLKRGLTDPDNMEQILTQHIENIESQGGDARNSRAFLAELPNMSKEQIVNRLRSGLYL